MHWTEWQSFGPWEWTLAAIGVAGVLWLIACAWLVVRIPIYMLLRAPGLRITSRWADRILGIARKG